MSIEAGAYPHLRGRLHQVAVVLSFLGLYILLRRCSTSQERFVSLVYGLSAIALYGTSTVYHVYSRSVRVRAILKRADHAMIYILIAGTFTPLCALGVGGAEGMAILVVVWVISFVGAVCKVWLIDSHPRLAKSFYGVLSIPGLLVIPFVAKDPTLLALLLLGGVTYGAGAWLFATGRPRLWPKWFGYHEVWHACSLAAGTCFYLVNLSIISP